MAFEQKSQRFLAGSLNLASPGDKIPAGDAIAMSNWRVDADGVLRSRLEEAVVIGGFTEPIKTLWMYEANPYPYRYVADAIGLYRYTSGVATQLVPNPGGAVMGCANYQGYAWFLNERTAGRDPATGLSTELTTWVPAAPANAPVATPIAPITGPGITGAYSYWISFFTADGFESNLSPPGNVTDAANANSLADIMVSGDPSVAGRYVYRSGGGQDQLYQVAIINDNVTTTLADEEMTDLAAAEEGITHTLDHDPPPPALGMGGPYFDHLCCWNIPGNVNRWWWTKSLQPGYWPGANPDVIDPDDNWVDVGDDGEQILWTEFHAAFALIYKERSIWMLIGDPDSPNAILERISRDVGLSGLRALASIGAVDYFQGPYGLASTNGQGTTDVSRAKMGPLFRGDALDFVSGTIAGLPIQNPIVPINRTPSVMALSVMAQRDGRLYFSYADQNHQTPNTTLILDPSTGRFASDTRAFTALYDEGTGYNLMGAVGGAVVNITANVSGGVGVAAQFTSMADDQQLPRTTKLYGDLEIEQQLNAADEMEVWAVYDFGATMEFLGNLVGSGARLQRFPFSLADPTTKGSGSRGKNISIFLYGILANEALIHSFHLQYQIEERDAATFDTNAIQLFSGSYGQVMEFEVEIQPTGPVFWQFFSDLGGVLTKVGSGELALSTGRQTIEYPFGGFFEGRTFRLLLTSASPMQVFALRFYGRRLGVYVPSGGFFTSREQDLGSKRMKLIRRWEINAEVDGTLSPVITTDCPGGVWAQKNPAQQAVTTSGSRQWIELLMGANARGRQVRIDALSIGNSRIYAMRCWAKTLGEAGTSEWTWHDIPVEPSEEVFKWLPVPVDKQYSSLSEERYSS
jgi:hypothetical protein